MALSRSKVDVIVGNPPWLSYRNTASTLRAELERQSKEIYSIWDGGKYANRHDVAGLERYHRTLKREVKLLIYELPSALEAAIAGFVDYYNHRCYHEGIGNVTPADVYQGRRQTILATGEEVKQKTRQLSRQYYRAAKEQASDQSLH